MVIADVSVPAIGSTRPVGDSRRRGVVEICAREDSVLGRETPDSEGCEITRITRNVLIYNLIYNLLVT